MGAILGFPPFAQPASTLPTKSAALIYVNANNICHRQTTFGLTAGTGCASAQIAELKDREPC
jgi:hypothetical protein